MEQSGDIYNTNMPSLTLGCGTFGGNSTTANVSSVNLINIKKEVSFNNGTSAADNFYRNSDVRCVQ